MKTLTSKIPNVKLKLPVAGGATIQFTDGKCTVSDEIADILISIGAAHYNIFRQYSGPFPPNTTILVVRDTGFGDVLLITPLVRKLKALGAIVDVMCNRENMLIFDHNPYVRRVFSLQEDNQKRDRWDITLDLRMVVENLELAGTHDHRVDAFCKVADIEAGDDKHLDFYLTESEIVWGKDWVSLMRGDQHTTIAYNWTSSRYNRNWGESTHRAVLNHLCTLGYSCIVTHTTKLDLSSYHPSIINASGDLSMRELAAVLKASDVVLTPDTGIFHLAGSLDCPTVAYFGAMDVTERETHTKLVTIDARHNCARYPCRQYFCMNKADDDQPHCLDIPPAEVVSAIEKILERPTPSYRKSNNMKIETTCKKVIATTHYRRPKYSQQFFDALGKCNNIKDYLVLVHIDIDTNNFNSCVEVRKIAQSFKDSGKAGDVQIIVSHPRRGVDESKLFLLPLAFSISDYVIFLEDDTIPSKDALDWFVWAGDKYKDDTEITSITGYNRISSIEGINPYQYEEQEAFIPWGWAMWEDRYEAIYGLDGNLYRSNVSNINGEFDWWARANKVKCVFPTVARIQSIGAELAEHTPSPEWHKENEFNEFGAWDLNLKAGKHKWTKI